MPDRRPDPMMVLSHAAREPATRGLTQEGPMLELIRTNDVVLIDVVRGLLESEAIPVLVADSHISVLEGSIGAFPRRLLVPIDRADLSTPTPREGPVLCRERLGGLLKTYYREAA